jgi:hypothetical protein
LKSAGPLCSLGPPYCTALAIVLRGKSFVTYKVVALQYLSNIARRVLVQLLIVSEYYNCDIDRAEDGKLMRLLEKSAFALEEGSEEATSASIMRKREAMERHLHRTISIVLDSLDLNLSSTHSSYAATLRVADGNQPALGRDLDGFDGRRSCSGIVCIYELQRLIDNWLVARLRRGCSWCVAKSRWWWWSRAVDGSCLVLDSDEAAEIATTRLDNYNGYDGALRQQL